MSAVKTTIKHIRRTPYQALASIFIMTLTILAISVFAFIVFGSSVAIKYFESKPQVVAFFKDEATQDDITQLQHSLVATGKVASVKFVSKKDAVQIYNKQNKDDPLLKEFVSESILPESIEVSTYNIEDLKPISDALKTNPHVDTVIYLEDVVSTLTSLTNGVRMVGLILIVVLALVSVFIMMTVIGFKVSQKRDEIEIMKLLSATNWYIRKPFILEGVLYGIGGTILGWLVASGALLYATPTIESFQKGIPLVPVSPTFLFGLLLVEMLIAIILGMLASSLAVLRYLK
jgi:cell division transport system permease protein